MADLLTPSVNVPAEREKLRRLRNEIASDVALREAHQRKYSPRGFPLLPDVHPLAAQEVRRDGEAPIRPLRAGTAVVVSPATADVREAKAGCCGRCSREGCMEREGVSL